MVMDTAGDITVGLITLFKYPTEPDPLLNNVAIYQGAFKVESAKPKTLYRLVSDMRDL